MNIIEPGILFLKGTLILSVLSKALEIQFWIENVRLIDGAEIDKSMCH